MWYNDGSDWIEATVIKAGASVSVKLTESGRRGTNVNPEDISPLEYEDDEEDGSEEEGGSEEEEGGETVCKEGGVGDR